MGLLSEDFMFKEGKKEALLHLKHAKPHGII